MSSIAKIISGGQTGADRGGLDAAIDSGVPHGGWCPKGRISEDGVIPAHYNLVETKSTAYPARTEANIVDAHCTVVFTFGKPTGGSKKTVALAEKHQRSCLCVDLAALTDEAAARGVLQNPNRSFAHFFPRFLIRALRGEFAKTAFPTVSQICPISTEGVETRCRKKEGVEDAGKS